MLRFQSVPPCTLVLLAPVPNSELLVSRPWCALPETKLRTSREEKNTEDLRCFRPPIAQSHCWSRRPLLSTNQKDPEESAPAFLPEVCSYEKQKLSPGAYLRHCPHGSHPQTHGVLKVMRTQVHITKAQPCILRPREPVESTHCRILLICWEELITFPGK